MLADYFRFALKSLWARGMRSWLTMLGIFVGIAAVVALISLGQGLQNYINDEFERVGVNRIIIMPGGGDAGGIESMASSVLASAKLTKSDFEAVRNVKGIDTGTALLRKTMNIKFKGETAQTNVMGADFSRGSVEYIKKVDFLQLSEGRYPESTEKRTAFMGYDLAKDTFDEEVVRGGKVTIEDVEFEIVGINKKTGQPHQDNKLVVPVQELRRIYGIEDEEVSMIFLEVRERENVSQVAEEVNKKLRRYRGLKTGEEDYNVQTAQQMLDSFNSILGVVQTVLGGIAAISLIVGGLGIMTTMYTSVLERTRQIGIMKAVGARNSNIMTLFLIESGILGMAGGIIGVFLGLSISFGASYVATNFYDTDLLQAYAGPELIFGAIAFSFIVGCLSGILPSIQAANMRPVDAIRGR